MFHLLLILSVTLYGLTGSYFSSNNQNFGGKWMFLTFLHGIFGPWFLVSRYSNNLKFDSVVYDSILLFSFWLGLIYLGQGEFHTKDFIGLALVIFGITVIKI